MILKPNRPWLEFTFIGFLIFLFLAIVQLTLNKNDFLLVIPAILFLAMALILVLRINKTYRAYELSENFKFKGYFWGHSEIAFEQLAGFRIKERKEGKYLITVFDIIFSLSNGEELIIRESNYKENLIKSFKDTLTEKGIEFKGIEHFSWKKSFHDFLRLKWFE